MVPPGIKLDIQASTGKQIRNYVYRCEIMCFILTSRAADLMIETVSKKGVREYICGTGRRQPSGAIFLSITHVLLIFHSFKEFRIQAHIL